MSPRDENKAVQHSDQIASEDVGYDETSGIYRTQFDFPNRNLSEAVIESVSTAADSDPLNLTPLHSIVDPDALDNLFIPTATDGPRGDGSVKFELDDHQVVAHSYGVIEVHPPEEDE